MKVKRTLVAPALVLGVALVSGGWLLQRAAPPEARILDRARLFNEVVRVVSDRYVEPQAPGDLYRMAVEGMLEGLDDPHTVFLDPDDYEALRRQTSGEYAGLGIQIGQRDGWITAVAILPETPAERAGVRVGDRMTRIEGRSTEGWTADEAVQALRGPAGDAAEFRVERIGVAEPIDFRIVREPIRLRSVPYAYMLDDRVGYVDLTVFSQSSVDEISAAIERLRGEGMEALVLDLRGNPGGLLTEGVAVTDLFLPRGAEIVETRGRRPEESETFRASDDADQGDLPVAVLVDEYSASAAEIVAGALQDHDRALVVGAPTYGKGSVQTLFPLSGGNYLKMTTARWYTPVGRSIQKTRREEDATASTVGDEAVMGEDGTPVRVDTAGREAFRTAGGRLVYGGGGIVPDVLVSEDTATAEEQAFFQAVGAKAAVFNDVLFRYAIEYERGHPGLRRDFRVTGEMRDELFRRLRGAGVEVTRETFDGATEFVDGRLVAEIATARWGREAAARRDDARDRPLQEAVRRLRVTRSPTALVREAEPPAG